ncbi:unnamed protein product, partial [Prorocentrum cordatum]
MSTAPGIETWPGWVALGDDGTDEDDRFVTHEDEEVDNGDEEEGAPVTLAEPGEWRTRGQRLRKLAALKKEDTSLPDRHLNRAVEANQQLMSSISRRCGAPEGWAEAVAQTKALEAMQQHLLEEMSLPVHEVGQ